MGPFMNDNIRLNDGDFSDQDDFYLADMIILQVMIGTESGKIYQAPGPTATVGRASGCDIQLPDNTVSRTHLKISLRGEGWIITDLWSRNGTMLNERQLEPGLEFPVREGDRITLGKTTIYLRRKFQEEDQDTISLELDATGSSLSRLKAAYEDRPMTYLKNMELLHVMSESLMGSLSLPDVFQKIVDSLFDLFKRIDRAAILKINPETGDLEEVIARTRNGSPETYGAYSSTIINDVVKTGEPKVISEFEQEEGDRVSDSQRFIRSVLCVPLISRAEVRGVIYVDSLLESDSFRRGDLYLLSAISSPAALAIENATLVSNLEQMVEAKTRNLREVEKQLRESEIRFKAIFRNMNSGAMVIEAVEDGRDFRIVDLNEAAVRIEGLARERVVERPVHEALSFAEECGLSQCIRRVWESGRPERLSAAISAENFDKKYREYYIYRLPSKEVVTLYDDITENKKSEKQQKELQLQLFTSQKMESIALIAGGVAHNFRNILQAIYGNIEYLEMICKGQDEVPEIVEKIYDSVTKGADLTNDLLQFAKTDSDDDSLKVLDLSEVITKTYNIVSKILDQKIDFRTDLEAGLYVKGNPSLLSQVFMNLFTNARDAMPTGGTLTVSAKRREGYVVAQVSDTGIGMSEDTLLRIFDPFFTLKGVGQGTGLGLSTSRGIIEQHRGAISGTSSVGEGSTFTISIPFAEKIEDAVGEEPKADLSGGEEKVLLVDDDPAVLESMARLVERLRYKVMTLDRPQEVLKRYGLWKPDLVLIDRNMPEMDGIACVREIKKIDPNARIIIASGYHDVGPDGIDDETRGLIRGYITKPCDIQQLAEAISQALKD